MSGKKHRAVRACLITSARSGRGGIDLDEVLPVLFRQGWDVAVREKREKGEATKLAREAAEDGYDPIVGCGGDGTMNEIVQALTGMDVAVGSIPGGTANVWPRELEISLRPTVAATQLVASRRVRIDVGRLKVDGESARHFLMMAGLGADGAVMQDTSRGLKNRLGPLAVGIAAAQAVPSLKVTPVRVEMDGVRWEGDVSQIIVGNTRRYGGFTSITPEAYVDDGALDICLFTTRGVLGAARQMASLLLRQQPGARSAELYRAAEVRIRAPHPLPLQIDGSGIDPPRGAGETRYDISVLHRALTVLVPRTYDGALFQAGKKARKKG